MKLKTIWTWFKLYLRDLERSVYQYVVTSVQIDHILNQYIYKKGKWFFETADLSYRTCDYKTAKSIAKMIPLRKWKKYESTVSDCDDFAREFQTIAKMLFPQLPIGYCHVNNVKTGGKHALNFIIYKGGGRFRFLFIEPQDGRMFMNVDYESYLLLV